MFSLSYLSEADARIWRHGSLHGALGLPPGAEGVYPIVTAWWRAVTLADLDLEDYPHRREDILFARYQTGGEGYHCRENSEAFYADGAGRLVTVVKDSHAWRVGVGGVDEEVEFSDRESATSYAQHLAA